MAQVRHRHINILLHFIKKYANLDFRLIIIGWENIRLDCEVPCKFVEILANYKLDETRKIAESKQIS